MRVRVIIIKHRYLSEVAAILVPNSKTAAKPMVKMHISRMGWKRADCIITIGRARD